MDSRFIIVLNVFCMILAIIAFSYRSQAKQLELKLKKCEQIKSIPHCSEREIILFKDVIDKCFIERD